MTILVPWGLTNKKRTKDNSEVGPLEEISGGCPPYGMGWGATQMNVVFHVKIDIPQKCLMDNKTFCSPLK